MESDPLPTTKLEDIPVEILVAIFSQIWTAEKIRTNIKSVKTIIKIGSLNRQLQNAERSFFRQIVGKDPLFQSKLKNNTVGIIL